MKRIRLCTPLVGATLAAAAVAVVFFVDFFVLRLLHEQGDLDRLAVLVNVLVALAAIPGMLVGREVFFFRHHVAQQDLAAFLVVTGATTAALVWVLAFLWLRGRARARRRGHPLSPTSGRREVLRRAASLALAGGLGATGVYSLLLEPRWPRVRRLRLVLAGLPRALAGLRVVQLTDLHLGWYTSAAYLAEVVEQTNRLAPDLVVLTGDYVVGSPRFAAQVAGLLALLRPRLGTVGVLGNHDHWVGAAESRRALLGAGIRLLDNGRIWVGPSGLTDQLPSGGGLCVAGVGDLWEDRHDLQAALGGVAPLLPRLLLCHNPDFAETEQARRQEHRVDLMLCGHTHGGQVRLPGTRGLILPSAYGTKYAFGLVRGPAFPVYVSAGLGTTILPVRFLVRPEITLLELQRGVSRAGPAGLAPSGPEDQRHTAEDAGR